MIASLKSDKHAAALLAGCLTVFMTIWYMVVTDASSGLASWDQRLDQWMDQAIAFQAGDYWLEAARWVAIVTHPAVTVLMVIFVLAAISLAYNWEVAGWFLLAAAGAYLSFTFLKAGIQIERPDNAFLKLTDYSFPSGHTTMAWFNCLSLIALIRHHTTVKWRRSFIISLIVLAAVWTSASRLILEVHTASDVLAGFFLGGIWASVFYLWFTHHYSLCTSS